MGIFDKDYDYTELIRTTAAGIEVLTQEQIVSALSKRMKEIYGNDIDLTSTTADGQWIMTISLIIYNILNSVQYLNNQLDLSSASGNFLTTLCRYNNVIRRTSTQSTASLLVKYIGNTDKYQPKIENVLHIKCYDKNGNDWFWEEGNLGNNFQNNTSWNIDEYKILTFKCEKYGPIEALASSNVSENNLTNINKGDINNCYNPLFEVWQLEDAILGSDEESDSSLKTRRLREIGNNSVTTLSGLEGTLLELSSIKDCKIYNNATSVDMITDTYGGDGTTIKLHNIYICLRYNDKFKRNNELITANIDENEIANVIYNKLTPGILTTEYKDENETYGKNVQKIINVYNNLITQTINWKKCNPIHPTMVITVLYNDNFIYNESDFYNSKHGKILIDAIKKYAFENPMNKILNMIDICNAANVNAPIINNSPVYICSNGYFSENGKQLNSYDNKDTYFDYNESNITITLDTTTSSSLYKTLTLTIG